MTRTLPRRRYAYTCPDTGRVVMCWRGEAVDRVLTEVTQRPDAHLHEYQLIRWARHCLLFGHVGKDTLGIIRAAWRRDVRLRAAKSAEPAE